MTFLVTIHTTNHSSDPCVRLLFFIFSIFLLIFETTQQRDTVHVASVPRLA